jgi:hypothetical protein
MTVNGRIDTHRHVVGRGDPDAGRALLKRFWFDIAVSSGPSALPSALGFADPRHITFGPDSPYATDPYSAPPTRRTRSRQTCAAPSMGVRRDPLSRLAALAAAG